jgi:small ligand-binding sensory domain FIST
MSDFAIGFTRAASPADAARDLIEDVQAGLGPGKRVFGGLLLATAAAGRQAPTVGRLLEERWPEAELLGTSFEGVIVGGELSRDRPALALLAWTEHPDAPGSFCFEEGERDVARMAHDILGAAGRPILGADDLVLLFPDAHSAMPIESLVRELEPLLGAASVAGAAASGPEGEDALAWVGSVDCEGGLMGLVLPGRALFPATPPAPRVLSARATRAASPWLTVSETRGHWVDRLDGESPVSRLRRLLGLEQRARLETHLDRVLVRLRRKPGESEKGRPASGPETFEERFLVGIDLRTGSISLPVSVARGDQLAFAFPDSGVARESLRCAIGQVAPREGLIHFGCRARDARLHGDEDLESALVSHHARNRWTIGTVGPFQLGPDEAGRTQLLVHAAVVAALGTG